MPTLPTRKVAVCQPASASGMKTLMSMEPPLSRRLPDSVNLRPQKLEVLAIDRAVSCVCVLARLAVILIFVGIKYYNVANVIYIILHIIIMLFCHCYCMLYCYCYFITLLLASHLAIYAVIGGMKSWRKPKKADDIRSFAVVKNFSKFKLSFSGKIFFVTDIAAPKVFNIY